MIYYKDIPKDAIVEDCGGYYKAGEQVVYWYQHETTEAINTLNNQIYAQ